jgi:hypothetical protein
MFTFKEKLLLVLADKYEIHLKIVKKHKEEENL